jgi:hypothetical protein
MGIVISKNRPKVLLILWEDQSVFQPFRTTKDSNTLLANFLSYIAFLQAHKWVTLQYDEPLQM